MINFVNFFPDRLKFQDKQKWYLMQLYELQKLNLSEYFSILQVSFYI